jgi:hypothetical protein
MKKMAKADDVLDGVCMKKLVGWLRTVDGHDVFKREFFDDMGFKKELVDARCQTHVSSKLDPKYAIFDAEGNIVPAANGIHDLVFVRWLCGAVGADSSDGDRMFGRGSAARAYAAAILKHLGEDKA